MGKYELVKKCLGKQRDSLLEAIERTKEAKDNAPSAMESHSDTSRSQNEKLVVALEEQLSEIIKYEKSVDLSSLSYFFEGLTEKAPLLKY